MKTSLRIKRTGYIFLFIFMAMSSMSLAQQQITSFRDFISKVKHDLRLTQEQVRQVTPIIEDMIKNLQDLAHQNLAKNELNIRSRSLLSDANSALSPYLTADQMKLWKTKNPILSLEESGSGRTSNGHGQEQRQAKQRPKNASANNAEVTTDKNGVLASHNSNTSSSISSTSILVK